MEVFDGLALRRAQERLNDMFDEVKKRLDSRAADKWHALDDAAEHNVLNGGLGILLEEVKFGAHLTWQFHGKVL